MRLQWKFRTFDKPADFLVLKLSRVRFTEVSFRNYLVKWVVYGIPRLESGLGLYLSGLHRAGVVAKWRFGVFAVGLQMAIIG